MSKQTSADFIVANEGILYIKNFEYSLFRTFNNDGVIFEIYLDHKFQ